MAIFLTQLAEEEPAWAALAESAVEAEHSAAEAKRAFGANVGFYYGLAGLAYGLRAAGREASRYDAAAAAIPTSATQENTVQSKAGGYRYSVVR